MLANLLSIYGAYLDYYIMGIILLPAILFAIFAQVKVTSSYSKYSKINSQKNIKASEFAREILNTAGLTDIKITKIDGNLTDYYDDKNKTLALSSSVYNSSSIAALGIAAHEVGHALQFKNNYMPVRIRNFLVPVTNIASRLLWPLVIIGLLFNFGAENTAVGNIFLYSGVILFGLSVLISLATLPVEYNASNRAKRLLTNTYTLTTEEVEGASKVLDSAALTYLAALLVAILNFLRFILVFARRD